MFLRLLRASQWRFGLGFFFFEIPSTDAFRSASQLWFVLLAFWDSFVMLPCLPCLGLVNRQAGSEWHLSIFCWFSIHFILMLRIKYSNWRGGLACVFSLWDSFAALGMTKDKGKVIASEVRVKQSHCWVCYLFMGLFVPCCDSSLCFMVLNTFYSHTSNKILELTWRFGLCFFSLRFLRCSRNDERQG